MQFTVGFDVLNIVLITANSQHIADIELGMQPCALPWRLKHCANMAQLQLHLETQRPLTDVVLIDLPEGDLLLSTKQILSHFRRWPVVFLVPHGSEELAVKAMQLGGDNYLIKDAERGYLALLPLVLLGAVTQFRELESRTKAEIELIENRARLVQIIEGSPVASFVIDSDHIVTQWNGACAALTGLPSEDILATKDQWRAFYDHPRPVMADLILDGALESQVDRFYRGKYRPSALIQGGFEAEDFFPNFGEHGRWVFFTAAPIRDAQGNVIGAIETLQDITERREAEIALHENQTHLAQIVDGSSVATFVINREHQVTHWNRACEVLTGLSTAQVVGTNQQWRAFYPTERPCMADLILEGAIESAVNQFYHGKYRPSVLMPGVFEAEDFFSHFGDSGKWVFFTAAPLRDAQGRVVGAIETLQDMTDRRLAEEALKHSEERYRSLSITDAMTGLFNTRHFYESLEIEVERAERYARPISLLLMDVDNFKSINDRFGHLEGDRVLQVLADIIRQSLRQTDAGFRYGGEEFVVILPETRVTAAALIAERIRTALAEFVFQPMADLEVHVTISIGVSEYAKGDGSKDLVRRADEATYQAKHQGKNCVVCL